MTQKTESEILFEQYCSQLDIDCNPIPCAVKKTPDYELRLGTQVVIAELKQLDLNDDDISLFEEARDQGSAFGFVVQTLECVGRSKKPGNSSKHEAWVRPRRSPLCTTTGHSAALMEWT